MPSNFRQIGQIGGPSIWLHWVARFWLYQICAVEHDIFLFSRFFQNESLVSFSTMLSFISYWLLVSCSTLRNGEPVSAGPCWQMLRASGRQAGGGSSTLADQKIDEWGWVSVLLWISWSLWFSAEHFAVASAHSFPRVPAWASKLNMHSAYAAKLVHTRRALSSASCFRHSSESGHQGWKLVSGQAKNSLNLHWPLSLPLWWRSSWYSVPQRLLSLD